MKYVFLLNMGGVNNLDECEVFLKNMFNDKYILGIKNKFLRSFVGFMIRKSRLKTMKQNYTKIGGKSPLTALEQSLCDKLNAKQNEYKFDFISTYVPPFANEVLSKYDFKDDDKIYLLPLYPHHSQTTVLSSIDDFKAAFFKLKINLDFKVLDIFYDKKEYNDILINIIKNSSKTDTLIISAHSLPLSIIKKGDLYEEHIKSHFLILENALKDDFKEIKLAYQSKLGPVKWLEPALKDELDKLDKKSVLIFPISFCIDCSETVLELSIEYKSEYKGDYFVCPCPNDSDEFCNFILSYVEKNK